jgi:hypothetical protein
MHFGVTAFKIGVGIERGATMSGAGDVNEVRIMRLDEAVEMNVDEVLPRRRAPVPEQPWLDLLRLERLSQQGVFEEVDLADTEIVGCAPIAVHLVEHVWREWTVRKRSLKFALTIGNGGRQGHIEHEL